MNLASYIIGWQALFFREGDAFAAPEAGVCGVAAKPGVDDVGWLDLGAIEGIEPTASQEDYKLWRPAPGKLVLKDVLENKQELGLKITTNDVCALAMESLFRTSAKLGGAVKQFNPLSGTSRRGWLHLQGYDQDNELWATIDLWVRIRAAMKWTGEPTKPEWEVFTLYSALNTGAIE